MSSADLRSVNLIGTALVEANLSRADLSEADLSCADLRGAQDLSGDQLISSILCLTQLPEGFQADPDRDCS